MGHWTSKKKATESRDSQPLDVEIESVGAAVESSGEDCITDRNSETCSGTESSVEPLTEEAEEEDDDDDDYDEEKEADADCDDEESGEAEPKSAERLQDEDNMRLALGLWLDIHLPRAKYNICLCLLGPSRTRPWWESGGEEEQQEEDRGKKKKRKRRKKRNESKAQRPGGGGGGGGGEGGGGGGKRAGGRSGCVARVEAAGSGIVLLERLELPADVYVGLVKVMIAERLADRPVSRQILFAGHGGKQMTGFYTEMSEFVPTGSPLLSSGVLTLALGRAAIANVRRGDQVCIGGLDDTNMEDLQKALELPDPMQCLRALDLTPDSVPYWTWSFREDQIDSNHDTTFFLDGEDRTHSRKESIVQFASRLGLPSLPALIRFA